MTTYQSVLSILENASLPPLKAGLPSRLTPEQVRAAEAACEQFAVTQQWPAMEAAVLAQVHARVEAGKDLCRWTIERGGGQVPGEMAEALRMVLITYWSGPARGQTHENSRPTP